MMEEEEDVLKEEKSQPNAPGDDTRLLDELEEEISLSPVPAVVEVNLMSEIDSMFGGEVSSKAEELLIPEDTEGLQDEPEEEKVVELSPEALKLKLEECEKERDALAKELTEKDEALNGLDRKLAQTVTDSEKKKEEQQAETEEIQRKARQYQEETDAKISELKKQFTKANQEKESMVMKYALGEQQVITQRKGREEAERRLKAVTKEKDDLSAKVKTLTGEKTKIQQLADSRLQDVTDLKRVIDRWKEEVKVQEAKSCVSASRLKAEVDSHKETREQLDATIKHLAETRAEIDVTRKECADFMSRIKDSEEMKQKKEIATVQEQSAKLIIDAAAATEMESLREKYKQVTEENNSLSVKIQSAEKERFARDEVISKLKEQVESQKQEIVDLLAQVAEMESLRMQLSRQEEKCEATLKEVERLRLEAVEINADMDSCRKKEAELLEFTQKLTDKNVILQSDLVALEAKSSALEAEHSKLVARIGELETDCSQTKVELDEEKKKRKEETELLVKKLAEKTKQVETLSQQTLDAENEVQVLKRKNVASLRELTRELQSYKRQIADQQQQQQHHSHPPSSSSAPLSYSSRTSSNTSLNRPEFHGDHHQQQNGYHSRTGSSHSQQDFIPPPPASSSSNGGFQTPNGDQLSPQQRSQLMVPDSHLMVEKIVKLQRLIAKRQEKCEFLEEHIATLLEEIKKKNRLIQHYICTSEAGAGALSTENMEANKPAVIQKVHERKMSQSGGIMASIYSTKSSDANMTLELSLEINQKLQAVLEDTLLKNITLKENINTLGNEIAKISSSEKK